MTKQSKVRFIYLLLLSVWITTHTTSAETAGTKWMSNVDHLNDFFEKLATLEESKQGKVNIVHVGDSHIQADYMTDAVRQPLQARFGNGGWGFTFPYRVIRTNGSNMVQYVSDASWVRQFNVKSVLSENLGLSGIAMTTPLKDFLLQLTVDDSYAFNTIKVIYPSKQAMYDLSNSAEILEEVKRITPINTGQTYHKIKNGESLSVIARKYKVTTTQLMRANNMKTSRINAGKSLLIPSKNTTPAATQFRVNKNINMLPLDSKPYYSTFRSDKQMSRMVLFPKKNIAVNNYSINGLVLENDRAGVIYHTIGANSASISDYNKYSLFFDQLPILKPDLVVVSFGTNESFGRVSASNYIAELNKFAGEVRKRCPNTAILAVTPAPSMYRRRKPNTLIGEYSDEMMKLTDFAVWDLYNKLDGIRGIDTRGRYVAFINKDKIHYNEAGYRLQGDMLYTDLMKAYDNYKKARKN